jgi:hypothetical protein
VVLSACLLVGCGGVVDDAPAAVPEADTHNAMELCVLGYPFCRDVQGYRCDAAGTTTTYCCDQERLTCTCNRTTRRWQCITES